MAIQWNKQQQQVIDFKSGNLLVAAAAGSGKTAVLTEHVMQKILSSEHPVDIDRLLIMTFTSAAAVEMKERIRGAIHEQLQSCQEDALAVRLRRQINLLPHASISTVHSFCLSVIREHFYQLELEPGFRVGDSVELDLMLADTIGEQLEELYGRLETQGEEMEAFRALLLLFADRNNAALIGVIRAIYEYSQAYPSPEAFLQGTLQFYETRDLHILEELIPLLYEKEQGKLLQSQALAQRLAKTVRLQYPDSVNLGLLDYHLEVFHQAVSKPSFVQSLTVLKDNPLGSVRMKKKGEDPVCYDFIQEEKTAYTELINKLRKVEIITPQMLADEMERLSPLVNALLSLVEQVSLRYQEKKRQKQLLDYGDLEHMALQILADEDIAREYQSRFSEILVDEYQDSSDVQEALIQRISRNNVFMVGDVKQSIYGFRQAKPRLFLEKYDSYERAEGAKNRLIELNSNYRSRKDLLESINFVFYQLMRPQYGGICYDGDAALHPAAAYPEAQRTYAVELHRIGAAEEDDLPAMDSQEADKKVKVLSAAKREAHVIGKRIEEMVGTELVYDLKAKQYRPMKYSDIVILSRSIQSISQEYIQVLRDVYQIPCYSPIGAAYFDTMEISDLIDFLRILDNPRQDIPLVAVMVSPMFGFTAKDLARIRVAVRRLQKKKLQGNIGTKQLPKLCFYEQLCMYAEGTLDSALGKRVSAFLECFHRERKQSHFLSLPQLLDEIMEKTHYRSKLAAMPGSAGRLVNIRMLVQKAKDFEATSYHGVYQFLRYVERLKEKEINMETPSASGEADDVVRLMTIHKSKGLEFPVVFLSGSYKKLIHAQGTFRVEFHEQYGVAFDYVNLSPRYQVPSALKKVFRAIRQRNELFEELRVLYVAMTRAKEQLIVVGTAAAVEPPEPLSAQIAESEFYQCTSYGDWLTHAVWRHPDAGVFAWEDLEMEPQLHSHFVQYVHVAEEIDLEAAARVEAMEQQEPQPPFNETSSLPQQGISLEEQIQRQFAYTYARNAYTGLKAIVSVSELKRLSPEEETAYLNIVESQIVPTETKAPADRKQGAQRGTVYHTVMEQLDFGKVKAAAGTGAGLQKYLVSELTDMVKQGILTSEEKTMVSVNKLMHFFESSLGMRMLRAEQTLEKEKRFLLGMPAEEYLQLYGNASKEIPMEQVFVETAGDYVLIRGIIDAYFEEDGQLVIMDYKTDRVSEETGEQELKRRYTKQLELYCRALSQLLPKSVKECCLYSFALEREVKI